MLSWKQKSGTQDGSFRSSLFSTVSFPFAGGAIFTGCYIRCDSCVQHNVLFPLLSHRSLSSWPWWQQKALEMFSPHQLSIPPSTRIQNHSSSLACCLQWTTNFANLSRLHRHKRTFITILQPYHRLYLGHKPSHLAPETSQHFIRYKAQILLLWCLGEDISYLFHLEPVERLGNGQKRDGMYFWAGEGCAVQFTCNIQHSPAELKVKDRRQWKMLWLGARHAWQTSAYLVEANRQGSPREPPLLNASGQKAAGSCTQFHQGWSKEGKLWSTFTRQPLSWHVSNQEHKI